MVEEISFHVKNPHSIFILILLWTLWSYAHVLKRLFFSLFVTIVFFFCLWRLYMTQEQILKQKATYLCSCCPIGFYTGDPPQVSVSTDSTPVAPHPLAVDLLFGVPLG
jgi:hypothetical protein